MLPNSNTIVSVRAVADGTERGTTRMPRGDASELEYEFALLVDGLDVEDDVQVDAFFAAGLDDGVIEDRDGAALVTFCRTARDATTALTTAVADVERAVAGARVVRVDAQLVSLADLADLTGRTSEGLRLLATAARGPGGFPSPAGVVGTGVRVWRWADVRPWLVAHGVVDPAGLPETLPSALIDATNARLAPRRSAA